ncbi:MAG: hypothetical protein WCI61_05005 [Chloroflexota bacterium]
MNTDIIDWLASAAALTAVAGGAVAVLAGFLQRRVRNLNDSFIGRLLVTEPEESLYAGQQVFVSLPIGGNSDEVWEAIRKGAERAGVRTVRADQVPPGDRYAGILRRQIADSKVVLAVLTEDSPNLFYEIGLAEGLGKAVLTFFPTKFPPAALVRSNPARAFDSVETLEAQVEAALVQLRLRSDPGAP